MDIVQSFYDNMAAHYDKLFLNWQETTQEQAVILERIFKRYGYSESAKVLDCACGIGTQAIGLARLGYNVTASDISSNEIDEAKKRSTENGVDIHFRIADFRKLQDIFSESFDIVIAMDNALPHMLTKADLEAALKSITSVINDGGIFVASIRDYDTLLTKKPPYSPPYIHKTENGQRVSFQVWDWNEEIYKLTQYIIEDEDIVKANKFNCEYRATRRDEISEILKNIGCSKVNWIFSDETDFYQPIVVAVK